MPSPSLQSTLEGTKSMIAVVLEPLEVATRSRNGSRGPSRISDYRLYSLFTAASIVCTCSSVNQDHVLVTYNAVYVNQRSKIYWSSSSSSGKLNKARNIESRTHQCVYTYCTHSTHIVSNIKPVLWMMHNMPNTSHTHVTHPTRHTHPPDGTQGSVDWLLPHSTRGTTQESSGGEEEKGADWEAHCSCQEQRTST